MSAKRAHLSTENAERMQCNFEEFVVEPPDVDWRDATAGHQHNMFLVLTEWDRKYIIHNYKWFNISSLDRQIEVYIKQAYIIRLYRRAYNI